MDGQTETPNNFSLHAFLIIKAQEVRKCAHTSTFLALWPEFNTFANGDRDVNCFCDRVLTG
jgi:hypothetical protein